MVEVLEVVGHGEGEVVEGEGGLEEAGEEVDALGREERLAPLAKALPSPCLRPEGRVLQLLPPGWRLLELLPAGWRVL